MTWVMARQGFEDIEAVLLDEDVIVFLYRQNATEFWYQMHRVEALNSFIRSHPERIQPDGRPDLTGLDFDDSAVFDSVAGQIWADTKISEIEATGVQIVGDENFPDLWKRAGALKSKFRRVSLADCFGVALAIEMNASFWTSDRHELTALDEAKVAQIHFIR